MKNISQVILLSTSCLIWYGADNVCASVNVFSGIPKSGTHNTLHTTPYLAYPHLPHLRGERSVRCWLFRTERSAMLTSCLPQTLSNSLPEVGRVREGVTSEASISLSSKRYNLSFEGGIPPRELLTRLKSGEFLLPLPQGEDNKLNVFKTASVCFITDTGACSGEKFSNDETPGNGNGNPGGVPDYDTPQEQCQAAGYGVTSCPAGSHGDNPCPADSSYYQKCVCDANMTQTCTKPYYGVGPSCDGKYASCKRDDAKACKEDGYGQTAQCSSVQTPNKKCSYNSGYYDKCVCRSDLVTCTYPQSGVGEACGGKYASCQCPGSYKSCECGGAAGATSCTVNGQTTYSDCKSCCNSSSSNWCWVHSTCHGDCCSDGTIDSCDERCGGSGCSSSGGSDSGSSGSGSGSGNNGSGSGNGTCSSGQKWALSGGVYGCVDCMSGVAQVELKREGGSCYFDSSATAYSDGGAWCYDYVFLQRCPMDGSTRELNGGRNCMMPGSNTASQCASSASGGSWYSGSSYCNQSGSTSSDPCRL